MTSDGALDDAGSERLVISNDADWDEVDELRARCDAIAVGANTVRNDNPRLLVRSPQRQADRVAQGRPANPQRVVFAGRGDLAPAANVFAVDKTTTIVFVPEAKRDRQAELLDGRAEVVAAGETELDLHLALAHLRGAGVTTLMVEGGPTLIRSLFALALVDEVRVAVSPIQVTRTDAPRVRLTDEPFAGVLSGMMHSERTLGELHVYEYRHAPSSETRS